jgi:C1A family cysteine protease
LFILFLSLSFLFCEKMWWSLVISASIVVLSIILEVSSKTTTTSTTTTTSLSPQSYEPSIPNIDISTITLNIENNNSSDSYNSTVEEDSELELSLSSIIEESSKTSKSKKNDYKSKYISYIMSRNYKKSEYKGYVKNNKKEKIQDKFELYISSDEYINSLNANETEPVYGHTKFSDWTMEEKKAILLTEEEVEEQQRRRMLSSCYSFKGWGQGVSSNVNYRSYAQPVQNQGSCGSCWDFASIAQYEFNYLKYKGVSQKQSEQYVLDCISDSIGTCNGGWTHTTNIWLADYGSCPSSSYYSYDAKDTWSCYSCWSSKTPTGYAACITESSTGYDSKSYTYWSIVQNAAQYVSMSYYQAVSNNFFYISSSSPYLFQCDTSNIVGYHCMASYGTTGLYMLVKNSWGTDWGSNGYVWLYYTTKDTCDVNYFSFNYW